MEKLATKTSRDWSRYMWSVRVLFVVSGRERRIPKSYQAAEGESGAGRIPGVRWGGDERRETGGRVCRSPGRYRRDKESAHRVCQLLEH